jgi:hypothetical protein
MKLFAKQVNKTASTSLIELLMKLKLKNSFISEAELYQTGAR